MGDRLDDELGDPLAADHLKRLGRIMVDETDFEFAPVARIDQARGVQAGNAVLGRQTAPRLHKPGVSLGERDGDAGRDDGSSTRWGEGDVLSSEEIDPCIAEPRTDLRIMTHQEEAFEADEEFPPPPKTYEMPGAGGAGEADAEAGARHEVEAAHAEAAARTAGGLDYLESSPLPAGTRCSEEEV